MTISSHARIVVIAMTLATSARAQSTSRVSGPENPLRLELSVGYDRTDKRYLGDPSTVVTGAVAVRWSPPTTWVGLRATVYGIQRRSHYVTTYSVNSTTDIAATESQDRMLAFTVAVDAAFRIWRDLDDGCCPTLSPPRHREADSRLAWRQERRVGAQGILSALDWLSLLTSSLRRSSVPRTARGIAE